MTAILLDLRVEFQVALVGGRLERNQDQEEEHRAIYNIRMPPTLGNGKICYVELPATNVAQSAEFYRSVFGWNIRTRGDGSTSFDDTVGQVSGAWVLGRPPGTEPGLLFYVMVDNIEAAIKLIGAQGGTIVQPVGADAPEITARFKDPAGNIIGLYQHPR